MLGAWCACTVWVWCAWYVHGAYTVHGTASLTLLGTSQEYEAMMRAAQGMPPRAQWGVGTTSLGSAEGGGQREGAAVFEQLDRRTAEQKSKLGRSAQHTSHRILQHLELLREGCYQKAASRGTCPRPRKSVPTSRSTAFSPRSPRQ